MILAPAAEHKSEVSGRTDPGKIALVARAENHLRTPIV